MKCNFYSILLLTAIFCLGFFSSAVAHKHGDGTSDSHASDSSDVTITRIKNNIHLVQAGGGNIAVSIGDQGVFMVDNGLSDKNEAVKNAIKSLSDKEVIMLMNTHWHFDHTGNNSYFGSEGATIIAHDNVRTRLKEGGEIKAFNKIIDPAPMEALPMLTYKSEVTVHLNGSPAKIISLDPAHTDGDSIVNWPSENIVHTGDIFFNGFFPFIDKDSGGSLRGMVKAVDKIMAMVDDDTVIIPGHGPLATKSDLVSYQKMLKILADRLTTARAQGKGKEDWVSNNPLSDLEEEWGDGFLDLATFTPLIWDAY